MGSVPGDPKAAPVMNIGELCQYLWIHQRTLYPLVNARRFPAFASAATIASTVIGGGFHDAQRAGQAANKPG